METSGQRAFPRGRPSSGKMKFSWGWSAGWLWVGEVYNSSICSGVHTFCISDYDILCVTKSKKAEENFVKWGNLDDIIYKFKFKIYSVLQNDMIGQYEMLYDALYLSLKNLSLYLPYKNDQLFWPVWIGDVIEESDPMLDDFSISLVYILSNLKLAYLFSQLQQRFN